MLKRDFDLPVNAAMNYVKSMWSAWKNNTSLYIYNGTVEIKQIFIVI